jgi:hypothetical protein
MASAHWSHRFTLLTALMWALIPSCIAFIVAPYIRDLELRKFVYGGALTLFCLAAS